MPLVQSYEITLSPTDFKWLRRHVGTRRSLPAELQVGQGAWPIRIGYRGRYSRRFRKPSFDLWLQGNETLAGHAMLHLNASYRDPSLLRSRLAMEVFSDLGVPAPQCWHVWLTMNGQPMGLYLALEAIDSHWFRRQGLPNGCIFYGVGSQGNFGLINSDTERPKTSLAIGYEKRHPADNDFSDLVRLIRQVTLPSDSEFAERIDRVLDVETFLRWLIGVEFMSHTDGLVQNYALIRPAGWRWAISPWDCDGTFGRIPSGHMLSADDMPMGTGDDNFLAVRLLHTARWRRRYREIWEEALRTTLTLRHIDSILSELFWGIEQYALRDVNKRRSNSTFLREPALIRQYIAERTAFVRRRLSQI